MHAYAVVVHLAENSPAQSAQLLLEVCNDQSGHIGSCVAVRFVARIHRDKIQSSFVAVSPAEICLWSGAIDLDKVGQMSPGSLWAAGRDLRCCGKCEEGCRWHSQSWADLDVFAGAIRH